MTADFGITLRSQKSARLFPAHALLMLFVILGTVDVLAEGCPEGFDSKRGSEPKTSITLYVQGGLKMKPPALAMDRGHYVSAEERLINRCSKQLTARSVSDPLPERLNVFAYQSDEARNGSFIGVSSVDQRMAMEKRGPDWHTYVTAFPDLRFVGATIRFAHGLVTLDDTIRSASDLAHKRVGLVERPSSLRALQETVLINAWGIYDKITVREYLPGMMAGALERGEVDVMFMPVVRATDNDFMPINSTINREDLKWISLSPEDIAVAIKNSPVMAERVVFTSPASGEEVGLITFDVAWFTFASTDDNVAYEFARAIRHACSPQQFDCPERSMLSLLRWPELNSRLIHPGALRFYREAGMDPMTLAEN